MKAQLLNWKYIGMGLGSGVLMLIVMVMVIRTSVIAILRSKFATNSSNKRKNNPGRPI